MAGIVSYGAYVPFNRLARAEVAKAWGGGALPGEKAVASYDEDSLTMAVTAALDCTKEIDVKTIDALYFASTTSPYKEKQVAATIAEVLRLNKETLTMDFGGSLRGGTNALRAAMDAVNSGSAKNVLVCASEVRLGYPNGPRELEFGDGAAALLISNDKVAVTIEGDYSQYCEIHDMWRSDKDLFARYWEEGFSYGKGYASVVPQTVSAAAKKYNLGPKDFTRAAIYAPNARQLTVAARSLGLDPKTQVQDVLHSAVGNTGSAMALMSLIAALEEAKAGDRLLLVSYGNGCDVFILKVNEAIEGIKNRRGIKGCLAVKQALPGGYQRYLRWRGLVEAEPPKRVPLGEPSAVAMWRQAGELALCGSRCKRCGTPQYPAQRVCVTCQAKDEFEEYCFADKRGKVRAFSHDALGVSLDPPITPTIVDFEGGGRILMDMTDRNPEEVKVGMEVEPTFRWIRYVEGIYDYWWKCRPIRG
jgi:3-hydroxy-3-methylglutaryl CoA synthase